MQNLIITRLIVHFLVIVLAAASPVNGAFTLAGPGGNAVLSQRIPLFSFCVSLGHNSCLTASV